MKTPVHHWLKAFADLKRPGLFEPSIGIITRFEARLSLSTKFEDSDGPGGNWKWPGDQAGVAGFEQRMARLFLTVCILSLTITTTTLTWCVFSQRCKQQSWSTPDWNSKSLTMR